MEFAEQSEAVALTAKVLSQGGVVALPSDTVYGLVTLARFADKLFRVKRRPLTKPVGFFFADSVAVRRFAASADPALLEKLLPGKVTLVLRRSDAFPPQFEVDADSFGMRVPDDQFIQRLCAQFDEPLAQTSANLSGKESCLTAEVSLTST